MKGGSSPLISASALGQAGYIGGFCGPAPSLRAVFPDVPASGATCASAGVLGPVVGMFGALQAQLALRVLLDADPPVLGRMVTADLATLRFGEFSFLGTPEPAASLPFLATSMLQTNDVIVELRPSEEAPDPIVAHAQRLGGDDLATFVPEAGQRVVLCCQSGLRAWRAAVDLQARGFDNLALLAAKACT